MQDRSMRKLWAILALILIVSFSWLGLIGREIHRQAPPMPSAVVTAEGDVLYTREDIETGRQVYQSMGGQQVGSIWGHGGYLAPDWSADWLHRESMAMLDARAEELYGVSYDELDDGRQADMRVRLQEELNANTYDVETGQIIISGERVAAARQVARHYVDLFGDAHELEALREDYAIANGAIPDLE
ncbi:nitric-oxide reductase large subunit, partial [bacterium]|nr:nitric-oxide reductase large subunit [bacterium]